MPDYAKRLEDAGNVAAAEKVYETIAEAADADLRGAAEKAIESEPLYELLEGLNEADAWMAYAIGEQERYGSHHKIR